MSASSSSSLAASSDSGEGVDKVDDLDSQAPDAQEKLDEAAIPVRSRHGEKLPFQAPQGYLPSFFPNSLLSTFGFEAMKTSREKQLWVVKIPEGISPSILDGTVIKVPTSTCSSQSILAEVDIDRPSKSGAKPRKYHLKRQRHSQPSQNLASSTQLIAMAGGNESLLGGGREESSVDIRSFRVLLPDSGAQAGCYIPATKLVQEQLHLVMHEEGDIGSANKSTDKAERSQANLSSHKRKREQPVGKLNGRFIPAGARRANKQESIDSSVQNVVSPVKKKSSKTILTSPKKVKSPMMKTKKVVEGSPKKR